MKRAVFEKFIFSKTEFFSLEKPYHFVEYKLLGVIWRKSL